MSQGSWSSQNALATTSAPRSASLEQLQLLEVRLFAFEKQFQAELLVQRGRLQEQDARLQGIESKFSEKTHLAIGNGSSTSTIDSLSSDYNGIKQMESLQDQMRHLRDRQDRLQELFDSLAARKDDSHEYKGPDQFDSKSMKISVLPESDVERTVSQRTLEKYTELEGRVMTVESLKEDVRSLHRQISGVSSVQTKKSTETPHSVKEAKKMVEAAQYTLQRSIWDVMLFIGLEELDLGGSIYASLLATGHCVLQITLMIVFNFYFVGVSDIDEDTVIAARFFRLEISHQHRWLDPQTQTSLAHRLCAGDFHDLQLEVASTQSAVLTDIQRFFRDGLVFNGQTMVALALCVWSITMIKEIVAITDFADAVRNLPLPTSLKQHTQIGMNSGDGLFFFKEVSFPRYVFCVIIVVLKASIAGNLLFCGSAWLASTADVRDLLLNAVALEFIVNLDETMFEALTSSHTRALVSGFKPLKCKGFRHFKGIELRKLILFLGSIGFAIFVYSFYTTKMVDAMKQVKYELCRDPLDFTYGTDAFNFVYLEPVISSSGYGRDEASVNKKLAALRMKAVQEVLDTQRTSNLSYSFDPTDDEWSMHVADGMSMSLQDCVNHWNPDCIDSDHPTILLYAGETFGITSCKQMRPQCSDLETRLGVMARALCPQTCGCQSPISGMPVTDPSYGCPTACGYSMAWDRVREKAQCSDASLAQLNESSYWESWTWWVSKNEKKYLDLAPAMTIFGCGMKQGLYHPEHIQESIVSNLCKGTSSTGLKSIAIACPELCECFDDDSSGTGMCEQGPSNWWCYGCGPDFLRMKQGKKVTLSYKCAEHLCGYKDLGWVWTVAQQYYGPEYKAIMTNHSLQEACKGALD